MYCLQNGKTPYPDGGFAENPSHISFQSILSLQKTCPPLLHPLQHIAVLEWLANLSNPTDNVFSRLKNIFVQQEFEKFSDFFFHVRFIFFFSEKWRMNPRLTISLSNIKEKWYSSWEFAKHQTVNGYTLIWPDLMYMGRYLFRCL